MSISYEGIGEWCATFVCGAVSEGDIVKVSANGSGGVSKPGENQNGSSYLVLSVDSAANKAVIKL